MPPSPKIPVFVPVNYVPAPQTCAFCRLHIARSKPGSSASNTVQAYYNTEGREWECLACAPERVRWEMAVSGDTQEDKSR